MSDELRPENERYLAEAISKGGYHDRGEALNQAVDVLRKRDQLINDVNHGIEQLDRDESVQLVDDQELRRFFDEIKSRCRARFNAKHRAS